MFSVLLSSVCTLYSRCSRPFRQWKPSEFFLQFSYPHYVPGQNSWKPGAHSPSTLPFQSGKIVLSNESDTFSKIVLCFNEARKTCTEFKPAPTTWTVQCRVLSFIDSVAKQDERACWLSDSRKGECFLRFLQDATTEAKSSRRLEKLIQCLEQQHRNDTQQTLRYQPHASPRPPSDSWRYGCKDLSETRTIVEFILLLVYSPPAWQDDGSFWGGFGRMLGSLCLHHCCQRQALSLSSHAGKSERKRQRVLAVAAAGEGGLVRENSIERYGKGENLAERQFLNWTCVHLSYLYPLFFPIPSLFEVCLLDFSLFFLVCFLFLCLFP